LSLHPVVNSQTVSQKLKYNETVGDYRHCTHVMVLGVADRMECDAAESTDEHPFLCEARAI
jgi:hypothetical protein